MATIPAGRPDLRKDKIIEMTISYTREPEISVDEFADVLKGSTLGERRPVDDRSRLEGMIRHADVIVTARSAGGLLIGVSRAISNFHYCAYLSDWAVLSAYQRQGVGKQLIHRTHEYAGLNTTLILLSAPAASEYYPHIGMEPHDSCWILRSDV